MSSRILVRFNTTEPPRELLDVLFNTTCCSHLPRYWLAFVPTVPPEPFPCGPQGPPCLEVGLPPVGWGRRRPGGLGDSQRARAVELEPQGKVRQASGPLGAGLHPSCSRARPGQCRGPADCPGSRQELASDAVSVTWDPGVCRVNFPFSFSSTSRVVFQDGSFQLSS